MSDRAADRLPTGIFSIRSRRHDLSLGPRPRHDLVAGHRLRRHRRRSSPSPSASSSSIYPAARLGRARRRRDLGNRNSTSPSKRSHQAETEDRPTSPAIGITNQRETVVLWDRTTGEPLPPRHRLARSPHGRRLRPASRRRPRADGPRARPACCSIPISAARRSPGSSTTCPAPGSGRRRRARLRHDRLVARLQADRRQAARHRCLERLAHAADEHPRPATGTMSCCRCSDVPRAMLPRDSLLQRSLRRGRQRHRRSPDVKIAGIAGDQQAALFGQTCFRPAWPRTPTAPAASC